MPRHNATTTSVVTAAILRTLYSVCALALVGVFAAGCDNATGIAGPEALNTAGFPLGVGNRWEYGVTSQYMRDGDTSVTEGRITWLIDTLETVLGEEAYRFEVTHTLLATPQYSEFSRIAHIWFTEKDDTLRAITSRDVSNLPFVQVVLRRPASKSIESRTDELMESVLVYPLEVGARWPFSNRMDALGQKVVEAIEMVSVPGGHTDAFRVTRNTTGGFWEYEIQQWFTSIGIVKTTYTERDTGITATENDASPNVVMKITTELLSYDLQ
jgi:hypothetical protein